MMGGCGHDHYYTSATAGPVLFRAPARQATCDRPVMLHAANWPEVVGQMHEHFPVAD